MDKIFIIDAVNYLFRSYFAIGPMTNSKGISTSALYGFIRSLNKIIKDFSPKYMVAIFDGPDSKQSRTEVFADYKMHRKKAPDDLYPQFQMAADFCELAGIPTLCIPNYEADDVMATVAKWSEKQKFFTYLCTSDKDLFQLINDNIVALNAHKDNLIMDSEKVKEKFGVNPNQILDYLSIVGDASDNIPGIQGFGPKTASQLLNEFKTLENIYSNIEKISSKKRQEVLIQEKQTAFLSKKLATLHLNVQIPTEKNFYFIKPKKAKELEDFYKEMNFLSLLQEKNIKEDKKQLIEKVNYILIDDEKKLQTLIQKLSTEKEIAIDTETTNLKPMQSELVGIGLCTKPQEAFYIPLNSNIAPKTVLSLIKELLKNEKIQFIGHNIKYDYHVLLNYDIEIKNIGFDTLLASYLLNPQNRRHNLDLLTLEKFNFTKTSIKDLIGEGKKQICMKEVDIDKITNYCCEDVDFTYRLKLLFEKEIKTKKLDKILYNIELPLLPVLVKMERNGIYLDTNKLSDMSQEVQKQLTQIEGEIFSEAGKEFNINSPKQLSEVLYIDLGLTPPKKKSSSFSTAAGVLEKLKGKSPIINHIIRYRELQKLLSTYIDAIPKQINPNTKRVHTSFNQSITATGRLSSQNPNLQNIPIRTEEGKKIREGFIPQKNGWCYLSADYSQIELRLLAHFSEDPLLLNAFLKGDDIHAYTASLVYHVPIEEVTKKMRYSAKAVNFGILYGQGPFGLSEQINVPYKEASLFIKTYFERYQKVKQYLEECKNNIKKTEIAYTITGRQRPIPEINNKNPIIKQAAQRLAINTPLQGTAADIIKMAMIEIDKDIRQKNLQGYMILQIHDELLFEIPNNELDVFKKIVKNKMENAYPLKVPLIVDMEIGKNWSEC